LTITADLIEPSFAWELQIKPFRETLGLDARELAPLLVKWVAVAAAEARWFQRAAIVMK
jgi:hypothetical protein